MARIPLPDGDGPEALRALALRPELAAAVGQMEVAVGKSRLDRRVHELVRMRMAFINRCTVCMDWRNPGWLNDEALLASVADWSTAPGFTARERVALEYAERFATDSAGIDDALLERLQEHFDPGEIVDLTLVTGKYIAMGRFMQVLGLDQTCRLHYDDTGTLAPVL
jgi:alkylhydroperoxidase family enzyme